MAEGRLRDLEEAFQKVNYALFGLKGNNGLIGSLEKLAEANTQINKRIDEKDEKDEARWSSLQWKIVAGMGAIILLLLTVLGTILSQA